MMQWLPAALLLAAGCVYALRRRSLTPMATATGLATGVAMFAGLGYGGLAGLTVFFLLGSMATRHGAAAKLRLGVSADAGAPRTTGQVLANSSLGVLVSMGVLTGMVPVPVGLVLAGAVFSSAAADTVSSELGSLYGRRFVNILTFKQDARGQNGVVSLEGTVAGLAASLVVALTMWLFNNNLYHLAVIVVAGTVGNLADSFAGATIERRGWAGNNAVNFLNTAAAALVAWLMVH